MYCEKLPLKNVLFTCYDSLCYVFILFDHSIFGRFSSSVVILWQLCTLFLEYLWLVHSVFRIVSMFLAKFLVDYLLRPSSLLHNYIVYR